MIDRPDNGDRNGGFQPVIRLAYTLNNTQPVRCSYIGDEPLFYLDDIDAEDDDEALQLMSNFPEGQTAASPEESDEDPYEIFKLQFSSLENNKVPGASLDQVISHLAKCRSGQEYLAFAEKHSVILRSAALVEPSFYDRDQGIITINHAYPLPEQVLLLAGELRRVWQHRQGALIHPLLFHPDHAVTVNRIQMADVMTQMVRLAWELKLAGEDSTWLALKANGHEDLTRAWSREALQDFRTLNNGRAAASVFESWFLSERCRHYDRTLIQQMLADYQGYVFKAGAEESSRILTQQLIAALGSLPVGKNYLAEHAGTILADPVFTDIRDRSNANFLWFIKFEQSFREAEQELQKNQSKIASIPTPSPHVSAQADIVKLETAKQPSTGATIVDLQGWRRAHQPV